MTMNNDLISKSRFYERIMEAVGMISGELTSDYKDGILTTLALVKTAPTVDAEPVRHGHWGEVSREYATGEGADMYAQCSECGSIEIVYTRQYVQRYAYCPYCGAKMDGERKTE